MANGHQITRDFGTRALFFVLLLSSEDILRVLRITSSWKLPLLEGPFDALRHRLKKMYFDKVPLINESTG